RARRLRRRLHRRGGVRALRAAEAHPPRHRRALALAQPRRQRPQPSHGLRGATRRRPRAPRLVDHPARSHGRARDRHRYGQDRPLAGTMSTRRSRWLVVLELGAVVAIFVGDKLGLIPFSKTPFLLLVGWASLRLRGLGWRSVGLGGAGRWPATLALGVAA